MSFLAKLMRAALKKGNIPQLTAAFRDKHAFILPSVAVSQTYTPESFQTKLKRYNTIHNWLEPNLHPCFVQLLSLGQQMDVMLNRASPFPMIGLVHLGNEITINQLLENQELTLTCQFGDLAFHKKGIVFSVYTLAHQSGKLCISAQSQYLFRVKSATKLDAFNKSKIAESYAKETSNNALEHPLRDIQKISLPINRGRQYAKVSGDYNPIHLWKWSAKLLGFPTAIAHGMHTLALSLSTIQHREDKDFSSTVVSNQFVNPALLPCDLELQTKVETENQSPETFNLVNLNAPEHKKIVLSGSIQDIA